MPTIVLNEMEQALASLLAIRRHEECVKGGLPDTTSKAHSRYLTDLHGAGGEVAFCRVLNVFPDLTLFIRKGGHDCVSHKGAKIDVKTVTKAGASLTVSAHKVNDDVDVYALIEGEFPIYKYVGFARSDEVFRQENFHTGPRGGFYAVRQAQLHEG